MKKRFFKILTLIAVVVLFTGCGVDDKPTIEEDNQHEDVPTNKENEAENEDSKDEKNEEIITEEEQNPIDSIDLTKEPNELGEIMILMYHGIGEEETVWQRTAANFRKDLEYMYKNGYRMISLNDYAKGEIYTEEGYTPIILTFDDGRQNNFNLIEENGEMVIDSNCAVGILEEFKSKYPDFNVTASFFLGTNPFGQIDYAEQKLNWLIENDYDIGNHTYSHNKMELLTGEEIQAEIGSVNNIIGEYISDYSVETLALPHGSNPNDEFINDMLEGEYEGNSYKTVAVLDVGWRPAYSPFDTLTDFKSLYRVTASEIDVDGCGMYDYFKQFEENKRERFISDGFSEVITIPERHKEYLNMDMVGDMLVNIY
ncbi:polysaccharide deacetylase family protein [Sedimentibacter sp. MB31-C6]|uniref:polysaccharide deacetylase family protein n=1 Tax=Sedimentibacter sp. MB31-C6 TaxID=3109366 RepID=UPI002DDD873E|nr:polysaccharide deacetylase family protein [Sedimentibacter sp. MB36-C1]WSI04286.1 polysaccharide deacetylase family protein [Sedimentibacter sp. MB36-C1]